MVPQFSNYTRTILKQYCTTLSRTHFEWANVTFVAEHNITSAIVLCILKVASEANRAFTNICDLKCSQPKAYKLLLKSCCTGATSLLSKSGPLRLLLVFQTQGSHQRKSFSIFISHKTAVTREIGAIS